MIQTEKELNELFKDVVLLHDVLKQHKYNDLEIEEAVESIYDITVTLPKIIQLYKERQKIYKRNSEILHTLYNCLSGAQYRKYRRHKTLFLEDKINDFKKSLNTFKMNTTNIEENSLFKGRVFLHPHYNSTFFATTIEDNPIDSKIIGYISKNAYDKIRLECRDYSKGFDAVEVWKTEIRTHKCDHKEIKSLQMTYPTNKKELKILIDGCLY